VLFYQKYYLFNKFWLKPMDEDIILKTG